MEDNSPEKISQKRVVFDRNTLVPVGMVLSILGAVAWLTTMFINIQNNTDRLVSVESEVREINIQQAEGSERMARIETKLDILLEISGVPTTAINK